MERGLFNKEFDDSNRWIRATISHPKRGTVRGQIKATKRALRIIKSERTNILKALKAADLWRTR